MLAASADDVASRFRCSPVLRVGMGLVSVAIYRQARRTPIHLVFSYISHSSGGPCFNRQPTMQTSTHCPDRNCDYSYSISLWKVSMCRGTPSVDSSSERPQGEACFRIPVSLCPCVTVSRSLDVPLCFVKQHRRSMADHCAGSSSPTSDTSVAA